MIGLLIITHETLGAAYTRLAEHFFPHFDFHHVAILNVETAPAKGCRNSTAATACWC